VASDPDIHCKSLAVARTLGGIAFDEGAFLDLTVFPLEARASLRLMGYPKCAHPRRWVKPTISSPPLSDFMGDEAPDVKIHKETHNCVFCGAKDEGEGWVGGSMDHPIQWDYLPPALNPIRILETLLGTLNEHQSNGPDRPEPAEPASS
jgi:hypothetical protein